MTTTATHPDPFHPDDPPRIRTAADILAHRFTFDEHLAGCESAYRRATHQALGLAFDLVERSADRRDALRQLGRAERIAGKLRFVRKDHGRGMLLDAIRQELARRRKPAGAGGGGR
jgi:hypothetical protein